MIFQGDVLNFWDFIQVFVFTTNHHLKLEMSTSLVVYIVKYIRFRFSRNWKDNEFNSLIAQLKNQNGYWSSRAGDFLLLPRAN